MRPVDKFGKKIYGITWKKLCENGIRLKDAGYYECKDKLFVREESGFKLYADMRGTDEVPIWHDTRPLFYVFPTDDVEKRNAVMAKEIERLQQIGIEVRLSFYEKMEPGSGSFGVYFWCIKCNKAFGFPSGEPYCQACEEYCAGCERHHKLNCQQCKKRDAAIILSKSEKCALCGVRVVDRSRLSYIREMLGSEVEIREKQEHHIHYIPEKIIVVCRQCYSKAHRSKDPFYQQFRPEMSRTEFLKKKKDPDERAKRVLEKMEKEGIVLDEGQKKLLERMKMRDLGNTRREN
jgi:hypothetical protein